MAIQSSTPRCTIQRKSRHSVSTCQQQMSTDEIVKFFKREFEIACTKKADLSDLKRKSRPQFDYCSGCTLLICDASELPLEAVPTILTTRCDLMSADSNAVTAVA